MGSIQVIMNAGEILSVIFWMSKIFWHRICVSMACMVSSKISSRKTSARFRMLFMKYLRECLITPNFVPASKWLSTSKKYLPLGRIFFGVVTLLRDAWKNLKSKSCIYQTLVNFKTHAVKSIFFGFQFKNTADTRLLYEIFFQSSELLISTSSTSASTNSNEASD